MTTVCADCRQLLPSDRSIGATVNDYIGKIFPQDQENSRDNTISTTTLPAKIEDTLSEIFKLYGKNNNWNKDETKSITSTAIRDAINFIVLLPSRIPLPEISLSLNGAIDFEWDFDGSRCNVEIFGDSKIIYASYLAQDDREYGAKPFNTAIPKTLINLLEKMDNN